MRQVKARDLRGLLGDTFRYGEAKKAGVGDKRLYRLRDTGEIIELGGGVYRWADAPPADDDLVEIAERVPRATLGVAPGSWGSVVDAPSCAIVAGRAHLDLRQKARADRRTVDELMQFYVLECFLARLAATRFAAQFVLKGGVLLAAFSERRPTRDIALQAQSPGNDPEAIRAAVVQGASAD